MKLNKVNIYIAISSIALLLVLLIQVNWIFQTAKIKKELFNEKANMVLSRTTEALRTDKETCMKIEACAAGDGNSGSATVLGKDEIHKIDSLFKHYMKFYNFHIDYTFVVTKPSPIPADDKSGFANYIYNKPLQDITTRNGVELKLIFPDKKQYIIAEMGMLFFTSVILILIVFIMFWKTIRSLLKEKKISEHTTDFLNNMTHEFKTPLTNIALAAKLITKGAAAGQEDKTNHYTGIILAENEKLKLRVEHVLNMTAFERGEIPLQKTALDFHSLITDTIKSISIQIESKQGKLVFTPDATRSWIMGDKTHLTNAVCNLLDNAIKYSLNHPALCIHTANEAGQLVLVIADQGIGIDKEYHGKIFDKFFRVPTGDIHEVKGFGIGLAYVKKIIELHGGSIALKSEKGKGTAFTIILPNA